LRQSDLTLNNKIKENITILFNQILEFIS